MKATKFRVWDEEEKRYWFFTLQEILERRFSYRGSFDEKICRFKKEQYAGLEDLYEGDIVDFKYWIATSPDPDAMPLISKGIGKIVFIEGCFMIESQVANPVPLHYGDLSFSVVGNIHQNLELLEA